jgi:hypothetical protein
MAISAHVEGSSVGVPCCDEEVVTEALAACELFMELSRIAEKLDAVFCDPVVFEGVELFEFEPVTLPTEFRMSIIKPSIKAQLKMSIFYAK